MARGSASPGACSGPDEYGGTCGLPIEAAGLCYAHRKQRLRDPRGRLKPLRRYESTRARLVAAAIALRDADEDIDFEVALDRLEKAAEAFQARERRR